MSYDAKNSLRDYCGMGVEDQIPQKWFDEINKKELNILEVGFGKGSLLKRLDHENGPKLHGIDCSQNNFRHILYEYKVNANVMIADISKENFQFPDGHFDVVVMLEVLEHIMSPMHAMLEIKRVLKADGTFIFSWPEERLISGIGKEENQNNRKYEDGYHAFAYPGLFKYDYTRVFFNQLYFKIEEEDKKDYHIFFKMINKKVNRPEILDVLNGDYSTDVLYSDIKTNPSISI